MGVTQTILDRSEEEMVDYLCGHNEKLKRIVWYLVSFNNDCGNEEAVSAKFKFWKSGNENMVKRMIHFSSGKSHSTIGKFQINGDMLTLLLNEEELKFKIVKSDFMNYFMLESMNCSCENKSMWILCRYKTILPEHGDKLTEISGMNDLVSFEESIANINF